MNWLTDDLDAGQFQRLLQWLRAGRMTPTANNIKAWRRHAGLPVSKDD
ncbi:MAG TPA: hypothetical protein VLF16_07005 [Pseudomonas sp.]|nr:hypothetical protein [Pseudomonas sp.]